MAAAKDLGVHRYGYLHKHPVLQHKLNQIGSTGGKRATSKRPPCTTLPKGFGNIRRKTTRRPLVAPRTPPPAEDPRKVKRAEHLVSDSTMSEEPAHQLVQYCPYAWCARCGRTSSGPGHSRQQQWRRPCRALPSFLHIAERSPFAVQGTLALHNLPMPSAASYVSTLQSTDTQPVPPLAISGLSDRPHRVNSCGPPLAATIDILAASYL